MQRDARWKILHPIYEGMGPCIAHCALNLERGIKSFTVQQVMGNIANT